MVSVNQLLSASKPPAGPAENLWAFPLSFSQQRLWLLDQIEPGGTSYSIPWSFRLIGALHAQALEKSLNEIVRRHETLRTTFTSQNGEPVQLVHESLAISLAFTDLSSGDLASRNEQAVQQAREEAGRPIDLEKGPLIRGRLIRLGDQEHVLLLTLHHIAFDGWSRRVFARELSELYEAFRAGDSSPLPELRLQYADYVVWQRKKLAGKALEKQLAYWKKQLAAAPANLNLPADHPRPAVQTFRGTALSIAFSRKTYDDLSALASNSGATLFMLLLAGFQALLSRYSGDTDILVGTPIANRTRTETEEMIGLFASTLVLRGDLAGDPTVLELLRRTKQTALDAYANQDVPFEKLVEELNPERSLSHNPLFQVMFSLQNAARQGFQLSGLEITPLRATIETAKFDLSMFLTESPDGLGGRIEYNTDLFEGATIERVWRHYERLLAGAVANPELRLSELPLMGNDEQEEMLTRWNNNAAVFPDCCVHEWFEQQARATPGAIACRFEEERLTYGELNEKANQLAHDLAERGAQAGERIGVYLERSLDLLIALLAVQKSGAAYVPVDPGYPSERIKQILEQAQVQALVTQSSLAASVPENRALVICLDREQAAIAGQSRQNLGQRAQPEDAVYVMFTSGSTGRPKGVEVPHRAVVNLLASMAQELQMSERDVFPALASFAFDMCIPELYLALVTGGTVALGKARLAADGAELAAFLQGSGATIVHATPTTWRLLLEAGFTGKGLKRAIGAEALPPELCRRLLEAEPSLYNFYGPTETTVWSTLQHFRSAAEAVSIGRPLANTRIYILDNRQQPVPVGVEGEVYIGGAGVAHGYLHQPALTAERFGRDPFVSGGRMYRTGDRARYWADGRIEYRGRADFQVKLRGYRIELGEIEAVLVQHASVAQSVASVREDRPGDQRLVAYVVAQAGARMDEAELRAWVKTRLPDYMVPVRVVTVEGFALTPNGKVDRQQLPAVEYRRLEEEESYQAARTPVEEVMAGIWAEVLKLEQVGIADDFFQLGGHSLLGTQVMSRVRSALAVELPLRALFEAPTVRGLAQKVEALRQGGEQRLLPRLERRERPEKVPLSFAQQRLWFLDQLEPGNALYNVPYLVRWQGRLDGALLEQSLQEIGKRHEALRTRFVLSGDEPVQVIDAWQAVALKRVVLREGTAEERLAEARRQVLEEIRQPFDLAAGPLWRAALYQLASDDHIFVLSVHHIISDRWSLGVWAEELAALYAALGAGKPSPLPELPVQYADYALWQRACLTEELLAPQLAFWKQHLTGAPPSLNLPLDHLPGGEEAALMAGVHTQSMPENLVRELRALSRQQRVTLFMTLVSGFNVLLSHYTGQNDIVLGTDLANRTELNTEKLIGFFVNLLPFRTTLSDSGSLSGLLAESREATLNSYAHQDVQFDRIVEEVKPERVPGRHPLVQVLFVMQNLPQTTNGFGGLIAGPVGVTSRSRFDLVLFVNNPDTSPVTLWMYNPKLFEARTISRLANLYEAVLGAMAADPEVTIGSLKERLDEAIALDGSVKKKQFQEASQNKLRAIRRRPKVETEIVT
jgi:amino acid adenylation domain-containing protein